MSKSQQKLLQNLTTPKRGTRTTSAIDHDAEKVSNVPTARRYTPYSNRKKVQKCSGGGEVVNKNNSSTNLDRSTGSISGSNVTPRTTFSKVNQ